MDDEDERRLTTPLDEGTIAVASNTQTIKPLGMDVQGGTSNHGGTSTQAKKPLKTNKNKKGGTGGKKARNSKNHALKSSNKMEHSNIPLRNLQTQIHEMPPPNRALRNS